MKKEGKEKEYQCKRKGIKGKHTDKRKRKLTVERKADDGGSKQSKKVEYRDEEREENGEITM